MKDELMKRIKELEVEITSIKTELSKPDEPKFKAGDWVVNIGKGVRKATQQDVEFKEKLELWKPQPDEWVAIKLTDSSYRVEQWIEYKYSPAIWVRPIEFLQTLKD